MRGWEDEWMGGWEDGRMGEDGTMVKKEARR